jgi:hypothetical protein
VSYVNSEATRYFSRVLVVLSNYIHISMICFDFFLTFSCHNKKNISSFQPTSMDEKAYFD